jgi:hypothetical protein
VKSDKLSDLKSAKFADLGIETLPLTTLVTARSDYFCVNFNLVTPAQPRNRPLRAPLPAIQGSPRPLGALGPFPVDCVQRHGVAIVLGRAF